MKTSTCIYWSAGLVAAVHGFTAHRRGGLQTQRQLEIFLVPDPQGCRGLSEGFPEGRLTAIVAKKEEKQQPPKVFDLKTAKATLEAKQSAKKKATTATADAEIALAQFEAALEAVLEIEREQVEEAAKSAVEKASTAEKAEAISQQPIDVSIPYDAPARLAYEASDKSMSFADFKVKYEAEAVADVISKTLGVEKEPGLGTIDVSIPNDAPARLAYEASDKSMAYADFKQKYQDDAVADVIFKKTRGTIDVSIPYDAPARLAYEASDKSMAYADFKQKYQDDAVADVIFKKTRGTIDVSIPYDAPARLAYEASDKSMAYADFKQKYQDDAMADVIFKKARVGKEAEDEVSINKEEQSSASTDVSKTEALDERGELTTKAIQTYSDFLAPGKFAKVERKDGEPIPPQLRVLGAGYMDQLQKAAQNNPLALKDELEKRRVVEDDEGDPAR